MLLSFLPLTKTVSKGKSFGDGGEGEEVGAALCGHRDGASLQLLEGGAGAPCLVPSPRMERGRRALPTAPGPDASRNRGLRLRKTLAALGPVGYLIIIF